MEEEQLQAFVRQQVLGVLAGLQERTVEAAQAAAATAQAAAQATALSRAAEQVDKWNKEFGSVDVEADTQGWSEYKFRLVNHLTGVDMGYLADLNAIDANRHDPVEVGDMNEAALNRSFALYRLLAKNMKGRILRLVMKQEDRSGYEVYRRMLSELEPRDRSRGLVMLQQLLADKNWPKGMDFADQLAKYELQCNQYVQASGRELAEDVRIATVMSNAPAELRVHLQLRVTDTTTYQALRDMILDFLKASRSWKGLGQVGDEPVPMEVDAVKGKGKSKGKPCRHCGKVGHLESVLVQDRQRQRR